MMSSPRLLVYERTLIIAAPLLGEEVSRTNIISQFSFFTLDKTTGTFRQLPGATFKELEPNIAQSGSSAILYNDNKIYLWNLDDQKLLTTLDESFVASHPNGPGFITRIKNTSLLHNVLTGMEVARFDESFHSFGLNGTRFLTYKQDTESRLYTSYLRDVATGDILKTWENLRGPAYFAENGKYISDNDFLYEAGSDSPIGKQPSEPENVLWRNDNEATVALSFYEWEFAKINLRAGRTIKTLNVYANGGVMNEVFSPDRRSFMARDAGGNAGYGCHLVLLDKLEAFEISNTCESYAFSPDSKWALVNDPYPAGSISVYDTRSGQRVKRMSAEGPLAGGFSFIDNDKFFTFHNRDASIKIFSIKVGFQASIALSDEQRWIVTTPKGYFDGTPAGFDLIGWRFPGDPINVLTAETFFNEFYYPNLLLEILVGKAPKPLRTITSKDRRQPQIRISMNPDLAGQTVTKREAKVSIEVVENRSLQSTPLLSANNTNKTVNNMNKGSGARDVRLFRNGTLIKAWKGDVLKGKQSATLEAIIPIVAGENHLTAYAFNNDNVKSTDAELQITGSSFLERKGKLYILAIGINEYSNKEFNLKYAVPDAEDFSAELKRQQDNLKKYENTEIISFNNDQAKKRNMLDTLADLQKKLQPEDALVVYFAGHGTVGSCQLSSARTVNAKDRFYLVPFDLGYQGSIPDQCNQSMLDVIKRNSISDKDLEDAFEGIDAGQILLVIDACNSGQALESEEKRRGPMNSKGLAQLAYEKGMYILTAAQSFQEAKADKKIAKGHGYLTYALVEEALKSNVADANKDGQVELREWVNYAVQRVPQMQQTEAQERRRFVKRQGDKTPEDALQQPRVFYRREIELKPLIISRPA